MDRTTAPAQGAFRPLTVVLTALFFSGVAGIINQVIWQRSLKIFLGGSETLSTMSVVLVFMFGLGAGAWYAGRFAAKIRNPLQMFALVECGLFLINLCIAWVLSLDVSTSVYEIERLAVSAGIPLRAVYVIAAILILTPSCFLMGVTMPISSEVCQRQLGFQNRSLVPVLFVLNTLGATGGAAIGGFYLLPYFGQTDSLLIAATANGIAAAFLFGAMTMIVIPVVAPAKSTESNSTTTNNKWSTYEGFGFVLGFLALGYEMYLFRLNTLVWQPLPYTFAATLSLYLLFWSTGVFLASRFSMRITWTALAGIVMIAITPWVYNSQRWFSPAVSTKYVLSLLHFLPCLMFGILYGRFISSVAGSWGRDVGRFCAFNTIGSCLGILAFTLIGYEMNQTITAHVIAIGLLAVLFIHLKTESHTEFSLANNFQWAGYATMFVAVVFTGFGLSQNFITQPNNTITYYGRDGVVEIDSTGLMIWDGMEHSKILSGDPKNDDQIGGNNWLMATVPVFCHPTGDVNNALVIGLGCGMTASMIAKHDTVENVVVYDINHTLKNLLRDHPHGMRGTGNDPKIELRWRDGRTGLALNEEKFDIITQQPMYLMQAGSSILLSQEYMQLVKSRLKQHGVFCVYSYSFDNRQQLAVVRRTIESVFPHVASFMNGYMFVASDSPLELDERIWNDRLYGPGEFMAGVRRYERSVQTGNGLRLYSQMDYGLPALPVKNVIVTDDHPIVEYPDVIRRVVELEQPTQTIFTN